MGQQRHATAARCQADVRGLGCLRQASQLGGPHEERQGVDIGQHGGWRWMSGNATRTASLSAGLRLDPRHGIGRQPMLRACPLQTRELHLDRFGAQVADQQQRRPAALQCQRGQALRLRHRQAQPAGRTAQLTA